MPRVADWAFDLERREQARHGVSLVEAREIVARKAGIAPGTLTNLRKGRLKFVDRVRDKILAVLLRETELEIGRLQHELETLRRIGVDAREDEVLEAQSLLAKARTLVEGMK